MKNMNDRWGVLVIPAGILSSVLWHLLGLESIFSGTNVPHVLALGSLAFAGVLVKIYSHQVNKTGEGHQKNNQPLARLIISLIVFIVFLLGWLTGDIFVFFFSDRNI